MASLTDLFNPTFLTFLVILVLVVALVVVYFESKMREQNHKINSMFSIVSTLAEDMTGMKMGMNQIAATQFGGVPQQVDERTFHQPLEEKKTMLITVSDDEEDDYEEDDDLSSLGNIKIESGNGVCIGDSEEELSFAEDIDDELDEELSEENTGQEQFKVFKLNISKHDNDDADIEDINEEDINEESDIEELDSDNDLEDLEEKTIAPVEETKIDISDLKTISINLEEPIEKIDYKKLQLPKLKSIVVEKGLASSSDASKLKKAELLKLLGIE
jgi:hypothetical protein